MVGWSLFAPDKATRRFFFRKRPHAGYLLRILNQQSQEVGDLAALLQNTASAVYQALKPTGCVIWLCEDTVGDEHRVAPWIGSKPPPRLSKGRKHNVQPGVIPVARLKDGLLRTALIEARMSLAAPLVFQGEMIGWLGLGPSQGGEAYTEEKRGFVEILAYQAALAIHAIYLKTKLEGHVAQLRRAYQQIIQAQENERRQLTETLHDETLQHLADLSVRLGLLRGQTAIKTDDLGDLETRLAYADRRLREIVRGLHPAVVTDLGLVEGVIAFLETIPLPLNGQTKPIRLELRVTGFNEQRLPDQALELTLYRFAQNAISNALTHGQPRRIRVEFSWRPDAVEVRVEDDGCGMAVSVEEAARAGHFGLLTMRERIEAQGGTFRLTSVPGGGTQVMGCVPVAAPSPAPGQAEQYTFELS